MTPTPTEIRIMAFVRAYQLENQGVTPNQEEIRGFFNWAHTTTAAKYLAQMEEKGLIERASLRMPIRVTGCHRELI